MSFLQFSVLTALKCFSLLLPMRSLRHYFLHICFLFELISSKFRTVMSPISTSKLRWFMPSLLQSIVIEIPTLLIFLYSGCMVTREVLYYTGVSKEEGQLGGAPVTTDRWWLERSRPPFFHHSFLLRLKAIRLKPVFKIEYGSVALLLSKIWLDGSGKIYHFRIDSYTCVYFVSPS